MSGIAEVFASADISKRQAWPLRTRAEVLAETAAEVLPALHRALEAERFVDASVGFIMTDEDPDARLGFVEGFDREAIQRCITQDLGQGICGMVAETGHALHVTDIQHSLDPIADLVRDAGIDAIACEPLIADGRLLGTLSFASRLRHRFEPDELLFFRAVAKHVSRAIGHVRARFEKGATVRER
jgi:GAF domain-containing protein